VIHPPVETHRFRISEELDEYFLMVGRFAPYKKVGLAIEAFNELRLPLLIIGEGEQEKYLRSIAGPTITFLRGQTDEQVAEAYSRCQAFIFPGEEDFGITPVEAQAAGRPVIAFRRGGALDTVREGLSGIFFDEQTPQALIEAVRRYRPEDFDPQAIRQHALSFDTRVFQDSIRRFVEEKFAEHLRSLP
jgi:Glycosyltransferase